MIANRHLRRRRDRLYRRIQRATRRKPQFRTAGGMVNVIVARDHRGLILRTRLSGQNGRGSYPFVPWSHVRDAVTLLVVEGLVDRKGLERAGRFSSALMGILLTYLPEAHLIQLRNRRYLVRLREVRVHIGGCERSPALLKAIDAAGGALVLFSYYHLRRNLRGRDGGPPAWYRHVKRYGFRVLIDSGVFSLWSRRRQLSPEEEEAYFEEYCAFLTGPLSDVIAGYFAYDPIGDWRKGRDYLIRMLRRGLRPIPVYHLGEPVEYLDWLARRFTVIGLGGHVGQPEAVRERWFAEVFARHPNQPFHGLGVGSRLLMVCPFFSADTTNYLVGRPRQSVKGRRGFSVLTDLGQAPAAEATDRTVAYNIAYLIGLGERSAKGTVQLTFGAWLDGIAV